LPGFWPNFGLIYKILLFINRIGYFYVNKSTKYID
jgi:hypothetical protein